MINLSVSDKGFAIIKDSKTLKAKGFRSVDKREAILRNIQRGVLEALNHVNHEDLLIIELSDGYTHRWLTSEKANKSYTKMYSATKQTLNKLICRYRLVLNKKVKVGSLDLEYPIVETTNFDM